MPASPAMKPTARARRGFIRRCPAMPSAVGRSLKHAAHHPRRRADRDDAARAQYRIDAGLRQAIVRSADCRCHELHPQFLGQCRAAGDAGAGQRRRGARNDPRGRGTHSAASSRCAGSVLDRSPAQKHRFESGTRRVARPLSSGQWRNPSWPPNAIRTIPIGPIPPTIPIVPIPRRRVSPRRPPRQ